jgi:tRNA (cytidine/uridine-2'-O-)-methyltransferase
MYEPRFHIVLHQPEIPPNTGAVGRTCVALHAKLWLVRPMGFQVNERTVRRAGLDYWEHLNWSVVDDWADLCKQAGQSGQSMDRCWMFSRTATQNYCDVGFRAGDWLVFGSETSGLPPSLLADSGRNLRIPVSAEVRSLNLASAVAVAGYELVRQAGMFAADSSK